MEKTLSATSQGNPQPPATSQGNSQPPGTAPEPAPRKVPSRAHRSREKKVVEPVVPQVVENPYKDDRVLSEFRTRVILIYIILLFMMAVVYSVIMNTILHEWCNILVGCAMYCFFDSFQIICPTMPRRQPTFTLSGYFISLTLVLVPTTVDSSTADVAISMSYVFLITVSFMLIGSFLKLDFSYFWLFPIIFFGFAIVAIVMENLSRDKLKVIVTFYMMFFMSFFSAMISWQEILRPKRVRFYYDPQDYLIAAILIYADTVIMFICLHTIRLDKA